MSDWKHDWEPVIGLEIHVQLNTNTLLFGSAPNHFGDEPNINLDYLNTGQPGALPVINQVAVKKAVSFGLAVQAKINLCSLRRIHWKVMFVMPWHFITEL